MYTKYIIHVSTPRNVSDVVILFYGDVDVDFCRCHRYGCANGSALNLLVVLVVELQNVRSNNKLKGFFDPVYASSPFFILGISKNLTTISIASCCGILGQRDSMSNEKRIVLLGSFLLMVCR